MAMKQYIGASTPWHEDEVSRRRRVAEANRAAYDEARDSERGVRGGSVFSYTPRESVGAPDGVVGTASNTVVGPQTGNMPIRSEWDVLDSQSRIGSEFADLARRSAAVRQHNARIGVDSISAAMRSARSNGGRLPQNAVDMLSRNLGLDGKTSAVYGAGYLGNGDFDIDIVTRGANGGLQRTTKKITPLEQYNMMLASPGIWGEDGVAASQGLYNRLRNTRGKSELQSPSVYADNLRAYNMQMQAQTSQKDMLSAMKMLMDYEQKSKAPMSAEQFLRTMPKSVLEMTFPPRYEEGSDPNDPERPTKPYTPQEIAERTNELMESLRSRASGNDGERSDPVRDTLIAGLRKLSGLDAPQVPDDIRDFQQRQRERQMQQMEDAQARADITQRPQQLINYFKDGKWYSGNGYVRDGKVYDGQGYEIAGATPAEMVRGEGGRLVDDGRGGFAVRALPSARELVGGRGGAEAQGGGAQGGGVNWTPGHDLRNDGKTYKGTGWLGVLRLPNGGVATEYTMQSDAVRDANGNRIDFPSLVPTLTDDEVRLMVNDIIPNQKPVPDDIAQKAVDFARERLANGQSVFANDGTPQGGQPQPAAAQAQGGAQGNAAQGAEATAAQQSAHKMPPPDRETALAIKAARKNSGRPQQPESQPSQPTSQESAKAKDDLAGNEDVLVKQEADRLRAFKKAGGTYEQDEDGRETVTIGDWEYLSSEDKTKIPRTFDHLDDNVMKYQEKATERKQQFATERAAKEKELKRRAQKLFPYSMHRRELFVSSSLKEWEDNWNKSTSEKLSETLSRARPGL